MSTTDHIHKKVLGPNALKTNFISNTTQKVKDNEKRFSNISKDKQPLREFRQTVHKNPSRYNQEVDMQGSATILPQKASSRKNFYINQNNQNNATISQGPSHQRKQSSQQLNMNPTKARSPLDKARINTINAVVDFNKQMVGNNNTQMGHCTIPSYNNQKIMQQNVPNNIKTIPQLKNLQNKMNEAQTDREKSQRSYLSKEESQRETKQVQKINFVDPINRKMSAQIEDDIDFTCDQDLGPAPIQKVHQRKLSNHYIALNETKTTIKEKQDYLEKIPDHYSQNNTRTEKKYIPEKPVLIMEKTKSEQEITIKQYSSPNVSTLQTSPKGHKSFPHLLINNEIIPNRYQGKHQYSHISLLHFEEEMTKFCTLQGQLNGSAQSQAISCLETRLKRYTVQPNYIELKQKHFNWFMRAILVDWMMHVCYEFGLKRQTYHIAVALADNYLEKTADLPKSDFQLAGAAAMFIAAKLQEFEALSSADFSKSTDNRYSSVQIRQMELKICKRLIFQLNPPTLYMWANRFMVHWDSYIRETQAKYHSYFRTHVAKYFKNHEQQSYLLFREMMQMIDCSILDVQTLQFPHKILVLGFMYLILGKSYKQWSVKRIVDEFPRTSHYLVQQDEKFSEFNELFYLFLRDSFDLDLIELLPAVQYCSTYFTLPLNFDPPSYENKSLQTSDGKVSLQEFQSFQTYNGKMIDLIKKRYRGVYP